MMALRQAAHEYLRIRRHLGFKLHYAGKALDEFVRFLEQRRAVNGHPIIPRRGHRNLPTPGAVVISRCRWSPPRPFLI
jgi:hypothetical protein